MTDLVNVSDDLTFEQKDVEQEKVDQSKQKTQREYFEKDIQVLMETREGRSLIRYVVGQSFILNGMFTDSAETLAFREGHRNSALMILREIKTCTPNGFKALWKEIGDDL